MDTLVNTDSIAVFRYKIDEVKVLLLLDKETEILYMSSSDMAKILKYPDPIEMLSSDRVLEIMSEIKKQSGLFPLSGNLASVKLLSKIPMKR